MRHLRTVFHYFRRLMILEVCAFTAVFISFFWVPATAEEKLPPVSFPLVEEFAGKQPEKLADLGHLYTQLVYFEVLCRCLYRGQLLFSVLPVIALVPSLRRVGGESVAPSPKRAFLSEVHKRDVLVALTSFLLGGLAVGIWYESHTSDFSLVCQDIEWKLRLLEGIRKVATVRTNREIPRGTVITLDAMTVTHEYDEAHLPANAVGDLHVAVGRTALKTIHKGALVNYSDVFPRDNLP